jgi:hypothetical protein
MRTSTCVNLELLDQHNHCRRQLHLAVISSTSSVDRTRAENAPPPSTRYSDAPSSTVSIRSSISIKCSNGSPTIPSAKSPNCCLGTSPSPSQRTHLNRCPPILDGHLSESLHTHRNGPDHALTPFAFALGVADEAGIVDDHADGRARSINKSYKRGCGTQRHAWKSYARFLYSQN